jgi:hypothetical protein
MATVNPGRGMETSVVVCGETMAKKEGSRTPAAPLSCTGSLR